MLLSSPATATGGPPSGSLCFTTSMEGESTTLCQLGGIQMPSFIFFASCLIILLFACISIILFTQCWTLARSIEKTSEELSRLERSKSKRSTALTSSELQTIRTLMLKEAVLAPLWKSFEETLLHSPNGDDEAPIQASEPPESFFSRSSLIEENIHGAFFSSVPGILTGVGLLLTFVAILDGLSHVSVGANMDVKGIGGLINGLSGKFVSSIVAVSCAVAFVLIERLAYARPVRAHRKLLSQLSARFKRRTSEQLLHEIHAQLTAQALVQRELTEALAHLLPGSKASKNS